MRPRTWTKWKNDKPKILLITNTAFIMGELIAACERQEIEHVFLNLDTKEMGLQDFVHTLLGVISSLQPDFVLTVNHLGVDHEGVLLEILGNLDIPLASWFVDNPFLSLPLYPVVHTERTVIFSWDIDNLKPLQQMGYEHVSYLPLATDIEHFKLEKGAGNTDWNSDISFVGNSMLSHVQDRLQASNPNANLLAKYKEIASGFGASTMHSAAEYLLTKYPELSEDFRALGSPFRMLAFETLLTWQSTLEYRLGCIKKILEFSPLIVGDEGWFELLQGHQNWKYHPKLRYYDELPNFYPLSSINFNCTSLQMKGAVNQRIFDVPASGAFLITDHRIQMENLFIPNEEIISYTTIEEIPELIKKYIKDKNARKRISKAARKRILAEHTYDHRIHSIIQKMHQLFG